MNSFEIETDEKSQVGSEFMAQVSNEIRRALLTEKKTRKITQQEIAEAIGTSRSVINRQVQGLENLSARRIAELLWAMGWEPHFEARQIPHGANDITKSAITRGVTIHPPASATSSNAGKTIVKTFDNVSSSNR